MLNSRDLGLQLNQTELEYLAEQSDLYKNGLIPVIQVVYQLPEILKLIYGQRAQQSMVSRMSIGVGSRVVAP